MGQLLNIIKKVANDQETFEMRQDIVSETQTSISLTVNSTPFVVSQYDERDTQPNNYPKRDSRFESFNGYADFAEEPIDTKD